MKVIVSVLLGLLAISRADSAGVATCVDGDKDWTIRWIGASTQFNFEDPCTDDYIRVKVASISDSNKNKQTSLASTGSESIGDEGEIICVGNDDPTAPVCIDKDDCPQDGNGQTYNDLDIECALAVENVLTSTLTKVSDTTVFTLSARLFRGDITYTNDICVTIPSSGPGPIENCESDENCVDGGGKCGKKICVGQSGSGTCSGPNPIYCVSSCEGVPDGKYNSCGDSCDVMVTCANGATQTTEQCPAGTYFDAVTGNCQGVSLTCQPEPCGVCCHSNSWSCGKWQTDTITAKQNEIKFGFEIENWPNADDTNQVTVTLDVKTANSGTFTKDENGVVSNSEFEFDNDAKFDCIDGSGPASEKAVTTTVGANQMSLSYTFENCNGKIVYDPILSVVSSGSGDEQTLSPSGRTELATTTTILSEVRSSSGAAHIGFGLAVFVGFITAFLC